MLDAIRLDVRESLTYGLEDAYATVIVSYTVGPVEVDTFLVLECVVVHSVWNSRSIVVDMLNVVSCSVTFATNVSTRTCDTPWIVVEMLILVTDVVVIVIRLVDQT
jgi:hypothetical protein